VAAVQHQKSLESPNATTTTTTTNSSRGPSGGGGDEDRRQQQEQVGRGRVREGKEYNLMKIFMIKYNIEIKKIKNIRRMKNVQ
jgi:hypothetical protein